MTSLYHSFKGTIWKNHKYQKKVPTKHGGLRYVYGGEGNNSSTKNLLDRVLNSRGKLTGLKNEAIINTGASIIQNVLKKNINYRIAEGAIEEKETRYAEEAVVRKEPTYRMAEGAIEEKETKKIKKSR